MESGRMPDLSIIRCPLSLSKNDANPVPKPVRPVLFIIYNPRISGYCFNASVVCDGLK